MKKYFLLSLSLMLCFITNVFADNVSIYEKLKDPIFNRYISSDDVYYKDIVICGQTNKLQTKKTSVGCDIKIADAWINYPLEVLPFLEYGIKMENYEIDHIEYPHGNKDLVIVYFKYKKFKDLVG